MAALTNTTPGGTPAVIDLPRPLPGRRHVLGDAIAGLAGAVILAGAGAATATPETLASAPEPDAELIALAHEFCRLECAAFHIINDAAPTAEAEEEAEKRAEPLERRSNQLADRMMAISATTLNGIKAKARCVVMFGGALDYGSAAEYMPERLLGSLLSNLVGFTIKEQQAASNEMRRRFETGEVA